MGKIGDPRAVEPLIAALRDFHDQVSEGAAFALAKIGDPRAVQPLFGLLGALDNLVRSTAVDALQKLQWHPSNAYERVRFAIARRDWAAVVEEGTNAVEQLIGQLNVGEIGVRKMRQGH